MMFSFLLCFLVVYQIHSTYSAKELLNCYDKSENRGVGFGRALTELRDVTIYDCLQCCLDISGNHGECCTYVVYHHGLQACELFSPPESVEAAVNAVSLHSPGTDLYTRLQDDDHKNCSCNPYRELYTVKPPTTTTEYTAQPPALVPAHIPDRVLPVHVAPPIELPTELNFRNPLPPSTLNAKPPASSYVSAPTGADFSSEIFPPARAPASYAPISLETVPLISDGSYGSLPVNSQSQASYAPSSLETVPLISDGSYGSLPVNSQSQASYAPSSVETVPIISGGSYGSIPTAPSVDKEIELPPINSYEEYSLEQTEEIEIPAEPAPVEKTDLPIATLIPPEIIEKDIRAIKPQTVFSRPTQNQQHTLQTNRHTGVNVIETIERINQFQGVGNGLQGSTNFQGFSNPFHGINSFQGVDGTSSIQGFGLPVVSAGFQGLPLQPAYPIKVSGIGSSLDTQTNHFLKNNRFLNPQVHVPDSVLQSALGSNTIGNSGHWSLNRQSIVKTHKTHKPPQEPFKLNSGDEVEAAVVEAAVPRGTRVDPRIISDKATSDELSCSGGVSAYFVAIENELVIAADIPVKRWELNDVDDAVCQRACSNNQLPSGDQASCAAFNYFPTASKCQLSSLKLYPGKGGRLRPNTDAIFSQKFCLSGDAARSCSAEEVFFLFPEKTIEGYHSFPVPGLKAETLEECMRMCILEPACRSVVYESDTLVCDMKTTDLQQKPDAGKPAGPNTVLAENGCRVNQVRLQSLDSSDIDEAFRPFTGNNAAASLISFKSIETQLREQEAYENSLNELYKQPAVEQRKSPESSEQLYDNTVSVKLGPWNEWSACLFKVFNRPVRVRARECEKECPKGSLQVEPCIPSLQQKLLKVL